MNRNWNSSSSGRVTQKPTPNMNWNSSRNNQRVAHNAPPLISPLLEPARMLNLYKDNKIISRVQHFMVIIPLPPELHMLNEMPVLDEDMAKNLKASPQFYITIASENEEQVVEWRKFVSYLFHHQNRVAVCEWPKHGHFFILPPPDIDCRSLSVIYCHLKPRKASASDFPPPSQPSDPKELQPEIEGSAVVHGFSAEGSAGFDGSSGGSEHSEEEESRKRRHQSLEEPSAKRRR